MIFSLRTALRSLARSPGYVVIVVLSLTVGIGACVLSFSAIEAQLSSVALPGADRIVRVSESTVDTCGNGCADPVDQSLLAGWQAARMRSVGSLAEYDEEMVDISRPELSEPVASATVGAGFFDVLGVRPLAGRLIAAADCDGAAPPVAAVAYGFAQKELGGISRALGSRVIARDRVYTVVGVLPRGFAYPPATKIWFGCNMWNGAPGSNRPLWAIARLAPNATAEVARSEVLAVTTAIRGPVAVRGTGRGIAVYSYSRMMGAETGSGHWAVIGAVWLAFIVACANVANLTLIRALRRQREIAVRYSLGARARQIALGLLTESAVLVVASTTFGLVLARRALGAVAQVAAAQFGIDTDLALNGPVVVASVLLALGVTAAFGLAPMIRLRHADTASLLRSGGGASHGREHVRMKALLVGVQVALVVALSCGALIFSRAFAHAGSIRTDFDAEEALVASPALDAVRLARAGGITDAAPRLLAKLAGSSDSPEPALMVGYGSGARGSDRLKEAWITIEGREPLLTMWSAATSVYGATPSLLRVLGVGIVSGRDFGPQDARSAANVAIVNEASAHYYWPGTDPVGRRFKFGPADSPNPWFTVIGVARGTTLPSGEQLAMMNPGVEWKMIYRPITDSAVFHADIVARASAVHADYTSRVRTAVNDVFGPDVTTRFATLKQQSERSHQFITIRFKARMLVGFAIAAACLGLIGIQAVVAESVWQSKREIGIRIALGASSPHVLWSVLRSTAVIAGSGVVVGCTGVALAVTFGSRLLLGLQSRIWTPEKMLGGSITDPRGYAVVLGVVLVAVAVAALVPARRALGVDPLHALKAE